MGHTAFGSFLETVVSNIYNTALTKVFTVLCVPLTTEEKRTNLSCVKVSEALGKECPESILEVRYNVCLNFLAGEMKDSMKTRALLS